MRLCALLAWLVFALGPMAATVAAAPKRVLILHSFGRDFAPFDTFASAFRTELARRSADPVIFVEANLDFRRPADDGEQRVLVEYLRARFDGTPPDVVVTIGSPAARFYDRNRGGLFAAVPVVFAGLDARFVQNVAVQPMDFVVAGKVDAPALIGNLLQLFPATRTIAVVIGTTQIERVWRAELQREFAPYADRISFEWLDGLSLAQMQQRVAQLPPHSAIFYALLLVDAAGVPHEREDALAKLRSVANAPIFGVYESELGKGVVGGPYASQRAAGEKAAATALHVLDPSAPPQPKVDVFVFERPAYDWRELARWNIDHRRLPPDSEIRFRPPSVWEEHRVAVSVTAVALILQTALIAALVVQRERRRRAEREAHSFAGRLVTAHEDERRRLARELHDDVTQRLAGLAIEAAELEGGARGAAKEDAAHSIRTGLVELGEDVHALSYRLHPSVIEDLGLVEAVRIECDRLARQGALQVKFDCHEVPRRPPADVALCLFRVAQEALRNVERHAGASRVEVSISRRDGGVGLAVSDDGAGFDAAGARARASLGLASMRERVRLLGGKLHIDSARGAGTRLFAWVPLPEAA